MTPPFPTGTGVRVTSQPSKPTPLGASAKFATADQNQGLRSGDLGLGYDSPRP